MRSQSFARASLHRDKTAMISSICAKPKCRNGYDRYFLTKFRYPSQISAVLPVFFFLRQSEIVFAYMRFYEIVIIVCNGISSFRKLDQSFCRRFFRRFHRAEHHGNNSLRAVFFDDVIICPAVPFDRIIRAANIFFLPDLSGSDFVSEFSGLFVQSIRSVCDGSSYNIHGQSQSFDLPLTRIFNAQRGIKRPCNA